MNKGELIPEVHLLRIEGREVPASTQTTPDRHRKKARRKGDAKIPHKKEKWLAMMEYENLREKEDLGKVGKKHGGFKNILCLE